MSGIQSFRPRFFEGQYLGAEDLSAAVDYSRDQMARHALGAHSWGIAMGLQLNEKTLGGGQTEVYVLPGYAWDGFGRPITVLAPYKIPTELFKSFVFDPATDNGPPEGRLIEVWLRYEETATQNVRSGFEVCDTQDQRSRVQETFQVEIGARSSHIDRHDRISIAGTLIDAQDVIQQFDPQTPAVAIYDESVPHQELPRSDAKARWLISLGYVRWKPNPDPNQPGNFVKRSEEDLKASRKIRRYIGVVAESVQAADGILRMRDRTKDYSSVLSDDLVWVEGKLRVEGDARLFGGKLDLRHTDGQDFGVPLKIQRTGDPGAGDRALQVIVGMELPTNNHRFAVGPLKADGAVSEKFVVLSGGNVGIGTVIPDRSLTIQGSAETYLNVKANGGTHEVLLGADENGGIVSTMTNHDLQLKAGGNVTKVIIKADGNVGIGTATPVSTLQIAGDVSIEQRANGTARTLPTGATMLWNDGTWLRLNQNLDFSKPIFGVYTPGLFAPGSLNVGGAGSWGDPGPGNVWIIGNVGIGTTSPSKKLDVNGNINVNGTGDFNGAITANGAGDFNGPGSFNGNVTINGDLSASVKHFKIPHPLNPDTQYLIHSSLEGPEIAVFYRGTGLLSDGEATIILPDYFEVLTRKENRTVLLTPRFEKKEPISALATSEVQGGQFKVIAIDDKNLSQKFYWEVKAIRADVERLKITGKF